MDARLFDASQTGDVRLLHELLAENPLLLHRVALTSTENPLHVASIAGHVDFVKEIVRLKPDYVEEMNQDGFSPMHIASANGYLEIVREMLRVDNDRRLCRLQGRDEWTPLHYAASRGRVDVIREIVMACPESVEDVTVQGETVIHLAVKCSQFKAINYLVELVAERNKVNILNMKDKHGGDSVLHLATRKKQHQVVEGLLGNETIAGALEVNSVNDMGLTALDLVFPNETGDWEMEAILRGAGALRAGDIVHSGVQFSNSHSHNHNHTSSETHQLQQEQQRTNRWEYFQFKKGRDSPSDARTALLVVASLVATATFQVGLNPPNGIWQNSSGVNNNGTRSSNEPVHEAGKSIMGSYSKFLFVYFVVFNSIGFYFSLYTMCVLTANFPLQLELQICIGALYFAYCTAVINIAPSYNTRLIITVFIVVLPFLVLLAAKWARHPVTIRLTKPLGKWFLRFSELIFR
ncbi:ankyrin repeat-containing protein BDA1-like isoform X1 [Pyrus x bretschneideri]|uniref:ankyrin repeat-containing protein BDA1-like isoform X1 n=1 Tax=Pyrus x bretschneideri TaxID=225117 RepID=UPI00202E2B35|nr:ankyrin repeat-containing protein BDA1-like isoform X1 [Pyrus x bretschneideri]XP_048424492.1 ankyrin repeat-containing protein BDA1-like isoform X1 [Pyrus x bretschneideri]